VHRGQGEANKTCQKGRAGEVDSFWGQQPAVQWMCGEMLAALLCHPGPQVTVLQWGGQAELSLACLKMFLLLLW
jgi:hypothetical protein